MSAEVDILAHHDFARSGNGAIGGGFTASMSEQGRAGGPSQDAAELSGLELAIAVAGALGWKVQRHQNRFVERIYAVDESVTYTGGRHPIKLIDINLPGDRRAQHGLWRPDQDPRAAFDVESRVQKLGLQEEYSLELLRLLGFFNSNRPKVDEGWQQPYIWEYFQLIHADPESRCRAAVSVLRQWREDAEAEEAEREMEEFRSAQDDMDETDPGISPAQPEPA